MGMSIILALALEFPYFCLYVGNVADLFVKVIEQKLMGACPASSLTTWLTLINTIMLIGVQSHAKNGFGAARGELTEATLRCVCIGYGPVDMNEVLASD